MDYILHAIKIYSKKLNFISAYFWQEKQIYKSFASRDVYIIENTLLFMSVCPPFCKTVISVNDIDIFEYGFSENKIGYSHTVISSACNVFKSEAFLLFRLVRPFAMPAAVSSRLLKSMAIWSVFIYFAYDFDQLHYCWTTFFSVVK